MLFQKTFTKGMICLVSPLALLASKSLKLGLWSVKSRGKSGDISYPDKVQPCLLTVVLLECE